jgi:hypothetical protein
MLPREPHLTIAGLLVFAVWLVALVDGVLVAFVLARELGWT